MPGSFLYFPGALCILPPQLCMDLFQVLTGLSSYELFLIQCYLPLKLYLPFYLSFSLLSLAISNRPCIGFLLSFPLLTEPNLCLVPEAEQRTHSSRQLSQHWSKPSSSRKGFYLFSLLLDPHHLDSAWDMCCKSTSWKKDNKCWKELGLGGTSCSL